MASIARGEPTGGIPGKVIGGRKVTQLPSMPPRPYTPGKSGPFRPDGKSPFPGRGKPGPIKPGMLGDLKSKDARKMKDMKMRRDKIKAGFRRGGPSKAQLGKIRLGAMKRKSM